MRLIDADAVYKILESCEIRKATIGNPLTDWEYGYTCGIERAESEIECAPTVDAVPIKHGRWLYIEGYMGDEAKCSECRRSICVNEPGNGLPNVGDLKYCPFCGAKMDERKEE